MTVPEARRAVEAETAVRAEARVEAMGREVGQSLYLMTLMAAMLTVYIGLGLLAVRLFG
jgi:predicted PurR-regulated permease PerM